MDPVAEGHLTSHTLAVSICYLHVLPTIACCFSAWNVSPICSLLCLEWGAAFFRDLQFFAGYYWNMYGRIICFEVNLWTDEYRVVTGHLLQKQKPVPIVPSWTQATAARQCLWLEQQVALASALWRSYLQKVFRCEQVCVTCKRQRLLFQAVTTSSLWVLSLFPEVPDKGCVSRFFLGYWEIEGLGDSEIMCVECVKVLADVTQSVELLAKAIGGVDAVIVATGFRPSFDLLASWKVPCPPSLPSIEYIIV